MTSRISSVSVIGLAGPGAISLDAVLGSELPPTIAALGWVLMLAVWLVGLSVSARHAQPARRSEAPGQRRAA
ncbi:MAG TPA: hypothetical protein VGK88_06535 [bacterium]|jgi:hypothetical protein